jgi:hypothetical protein
MIICERCGYELTADTQICPSCGTRVEAARAKAKLPSSSRVYGQDAQGSFGEPSTYERGYPAQQYPARQTPPGYPQSPAYPPVSAPQIGYGPSYQTPYMYPPAIHVNVTMMSGPAPTQRPNTDSALAVEIILSLFGLFGVGWLIGGETTIGIVLLVCSVLLYWPIIFGGTILTFGLGLICLGPLAIGAIILNALLLHHRLIRKMTQQYILLQQQPPIQHYPRQ